MRGLWTHLERLGGGIGTTRAPARRRSRPTAAWPATGSRALKRRLAACALHATVDARRARTGPPPADRAGRLHQRRQVDAAQCAHRRRASAVRDRLFHTLDPTTRVLRAGGRDYLLTDTVGFIRKLPHQLVDAFGATLEETRRPTWSCTSSTPRCTRSELMAMIARGRRRAARDRRRRRARACSCWTRPTRIDAERRAELGAPPSGGAARLRADAARGSRRSIDRIDEEFARRAVATSSCWSPTRRAAALAELHELAGDLEREDTPEGVRVTARVPAGGGRALRARSRSPAAERMTLRIQRLDPARPAPDAAPTTATPASTSTRWSAAELAPGERASVGTGHRRRDPRRATPAWCCRARASRRATGSRSSTRPG